MLRILKSALSTVCLNLIGMQFKPLFYGHQIKFKKIKLLVKYGDSMDNQAHILKCHF